MRRILVIKLGAFGDFVHAFHAFAAIQAHHAGEAITLLTTEPYAGLGQAAPWFDDVMTDPRAPWWNLAANARTMRMIGGFDFVYDLQTSRRTARYFAQAGRPPWSGMAPGCSHPHANPKRDAMHTIERQREQLAAAGVSEAPVPDRAWLRDSGHAHGVAGRYGLLVPGSAKPGPKRWPVERYGQVARALMERGITPVVVGGRQESGLAATIQSAAPGAIDLTGATSIADLAELGAGAVLVVGNDTGPLHLAAAMGAPTVGLFSARSTPAEAAPRGPGGEWTTIVQAVDLRTLDIDRVLLAVRQTLAPG